MKSGFYWLKLQMAFIYFPLAFCLFRLDRKQFDIILISIFRWMILFAVLSVCSWILQSRALEIPLSEAFIMSKHMFVGIYQPFDVVFAWSNFYHPTYISVTLMLGLSIGWYYALQNNVKGYELAFYTLIVLLIAILTQSRFMIVAWLLVNILFVVYMLKTKPKLQWVVIVIITLIAVFALAFYPDKIKNFFSDTVRIAHYKAAFEAIEDNPFLGTGLGGMTKYIRAENLIYNTLDTSDFKHYHPHNQIIGDIMQTGILGFLSILSIIIYVSYLCIRQKNQLLFCFFSVFFLLMIIEMPLMVENGIMCFAFMLCLLNQYNPIWERDTKH
ncbi:MAG: O-antigen ligase family protein [Porphyromonadaceae bacterium]|nr:O-antigen ligase family protein [Porphyromonadaceae bacterium]